MAVRLVGAHCSGMAADFAGETARLYALYRRDLPAEQARALAGQLGLHADDVLVDLGCGTGQLTVPMRDHCAGILALDPEPGMLAGLRARDVPGVLCVLGADTDLPQLGRLLPGRSGAACGVGAVLVGNALHWTDEPAALRAGAALLRPGGGIGVLTQGPPMWLGRAPWQQRVRAVLERSFGSVSGTCGSDRNALESRVAVLEQLGLAVDVATWTASYEVDADWVVGHLGSALPADALQLGRPDGLAAALRDALAGQPDTAFVEEVVTTAIVARQPA